MKVLIGVLLGSVLLVGQTNPPKWPQYPPVIGDGTDAICATHADATVPLTCNNQVVDGTTEQFFKTTLTLKAGQGNKIVPLNMIIRRFVGVATVNSTDFRLYVNGTVVWHSFNGGPPVTAAGNWYLFTPCVLNFLGPASTTTPVTANCGLGNPAYNSSFANTVNAKFMSIDTTVPVTVSFSVTFSALLAGQMVSFYGFGP